MLSRFLVRFLVRPVVGLALVFACVGDVRAQADRFEGPLPPFHDLQLCAIQFENLLAHGETVAIIEALYRQEVYKIAARVEAELGPLAWSLFVPGEPNAAEKRLEELRAGACVRESFVRGVASEDGALRARSLEQLNRYDVAPVLPDRFFMDGASDPAESAVTSLRVELPPAELIVPGGVLTGRVLLDDGVEGSSVEALDDSLLAEVDGQTARVSREGLFVLRAPERAGTYTVEVRHQSRALLVPVEGSFTIGTAAALPKRPEVECPGFDRFLDATIAGEANVTAPADCSIAVPRVILPDQRLVVLGRLGNRSGRATRAFVGRWEAPLLARTPIAAVFDVSGVPAGLHVFALYEGVGLKAAAPVRRVRLTASSDRPQLARGEVATFDVRVEGLPRPQPGKSDVASDRVVPPIAFLDYVNRTPEIGKFRDQPDRFTVPIGAAALTAVAEPSRIEDQATLLERVEKMVSMTPGDPGSVPGAAGASARTATADGAANGAFADTQHYRGTGDGEYHVQVSMRLPDGTARHAPAIVGPELGPGVAVGAQQPASAPIVLANPIGEPLVSTGSDERGVFAAIDGRRLYFSLYGQQQEAAAPLDAPLDGPRATRLFDASCSGSCQCSIQSWDHAAEVGAQVTALDRSQPEWRDVTAKAETCGCDQARAACYSLLSLECKTRCKRFFESSRTDFVSGFATGATVNACSDRGACDR